VLEFDQPQDRVAPIASSWLAILRVPFRHGTSCHVAVSRRGRPASFMNPNVASAVGSSLSRETNPDPRFPPLPAASVIPTIRFAYREMLDQATLGEERDFRINFPFDGCAFV